MVGKNESVAAQPVSPAMRHWPPSFRRAPIAWADREPVLARALDREVGEFERHDLAVAELPVADQERPLVLDQADVAVREQRPFGQVLDIGRQHADAVAVVAFQIGLDQVAGDDGALGLVAAGRGE